jgi:hypothetical protein
LQIIVDVLVAILFASLFSPVAHAQVQIQIPGGGQLTVPGYQQAPPPGYQAPPPGYQVPPPGYGQAPPPGYGQGGTYDRQHWEHCQRLENREHEIRERLEHAAYYEDRQRLEYRLHQIHEERRQQCRHG